MNNLTMELGNIILILVVVVVQLAESRNVGSFWQVSDFHYDANYSISGDPQNMCHNGTKLSKDNGIYGNYLCDAPMLLVKAAVSGMRKLYPNPDFILWTGDSVPHVKNAELNMNKVYANIGSVTAQLLAVFPNTTILPVLGNHDPFPSNLMPYQYTNYYDNILKVSQWNKLLPPHQQSVFTKGGYYSYSLKSGLKLIGLNTNLYYSMDTLTKDVPDPADQFKWLEKELNQSRTANQKVYIFSHVAPGAFERMEGMEWFYPLHNKHYLGITMRYQDVIVAQFYGHEHTDCFRVQYDDDDNPVNAMFLSPAVTPWKSTLPGVGANNPSIRLYQYDRDTGEILDIYQYFLNLTVANTIQKANWILEYTATKDYDILLLNAESLNKLVNKFISSRRNVGAVSDGRKPKGQDYFRKYLIFNTVGFDTEPTCNHSCFLQHICATTYLDFDDYPQCIAGSLPLNPSHRPHHKPVPKYLFYIIGALGGAIFVLFIVIAICCLRKHHYKPPKYGRFMGALN